MTAAGTLHSVPIPVTATIVGLVGLIDSQAADLKHFNGNGGVEKPFTLASDRADLVLAPLPDEFKPRVLKATLSDPQPAGGSRRLWTLKVGIAAGDWVGSLPADSVVVLEAKTADGVRKVRIPVKGVAAGAVRGSGRRSRPGGRNQVTAPRANGVGGRVDRVCMTVPGTVRFSEGRRHGRSDRPPQSVAAPAGPSVRPPACSWPSA